MCGRPGCSLDVRPIGSCGKELHQKGEKPTTWASVSSCTGKIDFLFFCLVVVKIACVNIRNVL